MDSKVSSLNTKLDQRREKKRHPQPGPPNTNQRQQQSNRRPNLPRKHWNNPPRYIQPAPRRQPQAPPGHMEPDIPHRRPIPPQQNDYNGGTNRRTLLQHPPPTNNIPPLINHPNQQWGNINPGNQLGELVDTLKLLLQTLPQPPPVLPSFPQPPFPYRR